MLTYVNVAMADPGTRRLAAKAGHGLSHKQDHCAARLSHPNKFLNKDYAHSFSQSNTYFKK